MGRHGMRTSAWLRLAPEIGREKILANRLAHLEIEYGSCIMDTAPISRSGDTIRSTRRQLRIEN
jgi:hypothetical protein